MSEPIEPEEVLAAQRYWVACWQCPVCGAVTEEHGQDDVAGETLECDCGLQIRIEGE